MQISKGPTLSSLLLLSVMLPQLSSLWTSWMKMLRNARSYPRRSSKLATGVVQSVSVWITNKHDQRFVHSCKVDITYHILAKRASELYTVWVAVICCLEWIIYPSHTQVNSSRPPMRMTVYASGVRRLRSQRQTRGPQVRTLRRLPMSEFAMWKFSELSKDPGSASPAQRATVQRTKMEVSTLHPGSVLPLVPGAILVGNQGVPHRNRFSPCWHALPVLVHSARARNLCNLSLFRCLRLRGISVL